MAVACDLLGRGNHVVSVIGDSAMTAGLAYEAMNNAGYFDTNMHGHPAQRQQAGVAAHGHARRPRAARGRAHASPVQHQVPPPAGGGQDRDQADRRERRARGRGQGGRVRAVGTGLNIAYSKINEQSGI
jgi:hypothetical protein